MTVGSVGFETACYWLGFLGALYVALGCML